MRLWRRWRHGRRQKTLQEIVTRSRTESLILFGVTLALMVLVGYYIWANARTIDDLCDVAKNQRYTLVLAKNNTDAYLESPRGRGPGPGGLNDFIRQVSLPQLIDRLAHEQVPARCRGR